MFHRRISEDDKRKWVNLPTFFIWLFAQQNQFVYNEFMPFDVFTLKYLIRELNESLSDGKIVKINQPESDELVLSVHTKGNTLRLSVSCSPNLPRINIVTAKSTNPLVAPSFCMSLRKHISSGIINGFSLLNNDRIICIDITAYGEMLDKNEYFLIFELMGRYSNIILTDSTKRIISCCKQMPFLDSSRQIMAGVLYEPPATNGKFSIFSDEISSIESKQIGDIKAYACEYLMGFSTQTLTEIIYRAESAQGNTNAKKFYNAVYAMNNTPIEPCFNDKDFFVFPYKSIDCQYTKADGISDAIEKSLLTREQSLRIKGKSKYVVSALKNALNRTEKKIALQTQKLFECQKADTYKLYGDLLLINSHQKVKNADKIIVNNVYDANSAEIEIPLDNTKNLTQNSQEYYKKYTKLKRTAQNVETMLDENKRLLASLQNVKRELDEARTEAEIDDIKTEAVLLGLTPKTNTVNKKQKTVSSPHRYSFDGFDIIVGKNNVQNDKLTFSDSKKSYTWLHVKNYHGSHVVIGSDAPSKEAIVFAAELAAYYSELKSDAKVTVDYTLVKHVKKNGALGNVTYTNYSSIQVTPSNHAELLVFNYQY